jgi:hypothetical protein
MSNAYHFDGTYKYSSKLFTGEFQLNRLGKLKKDIDLPLNLYKYDFDNCKAVYGLSRLQLISLIIDRGYSRVFDSNDSSLWSKKETSDNQTDEEFNLALGSDIEIEQALDSVSEAVKELENTVDDTLSFDDTTLELDELPEPEYDPEEDIKVHDLELSQRDLKSQYNKLKKYTAHLKKIVEIGEAVSQPTFIPNRVSASADKRKVSAILQLSDLHIGSIIAKDYVNGNPGFNLEVASERMAKVAHGVQSFIDEKRHSLAVEELVVSLNGDLMEILPHGQDQLEIVEQIIATQDILYTTLKTLSDYIPTRVIVSSGNHDRLESAKRCRNIYLLSIFNQHLYTMSSLMSKD